jgi:hypothetical protein
MAAIIPQRRSPSVIPYLLVVQWVLPCVLTVSGALHVLLASTILSA